MEPHVTLYGSRSKSERSARYLGVIFDEGLRWTEHIKELKSRATKALDILKSVSGTKWGGDRESLLRLYRALVRPKMDYACFIYWTASDSTLKKLNPVHNAALERCSIPQLKVFTRIAENSLYTSEGSN